MNNIFFLSIMNGAPWGGSEELWFQSALATAQKGIKTGVCCFDWPEKQNKIDELRSAGCELYLLPGKPFSKNKLLPNRKLKNILAAVPFETYELVIINQGGWKDIVHGAFKSLHNRLNDFIILFHNYNTREKLSSYKRDQLAAWVNKARKNLGDTLKIFHAMKEFYNINIVKTEKLFNPLTFEIPKRQMPYPGLVNGKLLLSVFASLDIERKAQDVLIRSFAHSKWKERNWEIHLYGEGKDKSILKRLIKEKGLERRILLQGNASNYLEAVSQSHLVLQITNIDAMPITVMDSLALAKPLVVSHVGDMPHWVKENENGWVCKEVNEEFIQRTLEKAWSHRQNWEAMGKKSYELFKTEFPANPIEHFLDQIKLPSSPLQPATSH